MYQAYSRNIDTTFIECMKFREVIPTLSLRLMPQEKKRKILDRKEYEVLDARKTHYELIKLNNTDMTQRDSKRKKRAKLAQILINQRFCSTFSRDLDSKGDVFK
jgi:hypothetical protein